MGELATISHLVPAMGEDTIAKVRQLDAVVASCPQVPIATRHLIHAGLYARTITIPADVVLTGALIKIATVLIVSGHALMVTEDGTVETEGYRVFPMSAHRKAAIVAISDTEVTMLFATPAQTVGEAEAEFTDEIDLLSSRQKGALNIYHLTGA